MASNFIKPEMVKGVRDLGDSRPVVEIVDEAEQAFKSAWGNGLTVMPWQAAALASGQATLRDVDKTIADVTKTEVTSSYPISGSGTGYGFAVYNLEEPAKKIFPVLTPFRNRIPRMAERGSAIHWKAITAISGSGSTANAPVSHFIGELPTNTIAGLALNLPPEITFTAADQSATFQPMGASGSNSFFSQIAGRGYEDVRALVGLSTLQALMLSEERGLWSARATSAVQPASVTASSAASSSTYSAITGGATNLWIQVTATTMLGETTAASATSIAVPSGVVTVTWSASTGAEAYNVYVGTGNTDPGTASHFFAGATAALTFTISGALPTSGANPPTSDTTANSNAYSGVFKQLEGGAQPYINVANAVVSLNDLQTAFYNRYDKLKADVDEVWCDARTRREYSDLAANVNNNPAYRVMISRDEQSGVVAGAVLSAVLNESTGKEVPLRVHPWFKPGNAAGVSYTLPFPNSEVPNVWAVKGPQDYLQIDWPVIDLNYRTSVVAMNALVGYAPDFNFWLKGYKATTVSATAQ